MLPRTHRFSRQNFEKFRAHMKSFRVGDFLFLYSPSKNYVPKYAAVISKKVDKRAVRRNQFRRSMYQAFDKHCRQAQLPFNLICLYKGRAIPENKADYDKAAQAVAKYLIDKKL